MSGEFAFIEQIRKGAQRSAASGDVRIGIGDDAAALCQHADQETLVTVDLLIEEIDFQLSYVVPAWLVARLAVDLAEQGRGTGHATLLDALGRLVMASSRGPAARFVVVDAIDGRAFRFYEKFGFVPAPGNGDRLFMKMSTVRALVTQG